MAKMAGMKLRCSRDHWGWAAWEVREVHNGFVAVVPCDLGDHYLFYCAGADASSSIAPMVYDTRADAEEAVAAWELQEAGKE